MSSDKVFIIDSQPLYGSAMATLVKETLDTSEVIVTTNTKQILESVRAGEVKLIVMDVNIEGRDGIGLAKNIFSNGYKGKLLFVSSNDYDSLSNVARAIGAHGYLTKYSNQSTISNAIIHVMQGYVIFKDQKLQSVQQSLSEREVTVFNYLMQGHSNQKISELLMLSNKTVSTYKTRILKKYNAKSIVEVAWRKSMELSLDL